MADIELTDKERMDILNVFDCNVEENIKTAVYHAGKHEMDCFVIYNILTTEFHVTVFAIEKLQKGEIIVTCVKKWKQQDYDSFFYDMQGKELYVGYDEDNSFYEERFKDLVEREYKYEKEKYIRHTDIANLAIFSWLKKYTGSDSI